MTKNANKEPFVIQVELSEEQINKIASRAVGMIKEEDVRRAPEKAYSVNEVAAMLPSLKASTIRTHCREGILEASKTGKSFLITEQSLNKYLSRNGE